MNSYATIIIETLIPLLLIFKRTRNIGVLIGLLFHNVIAYNNHNGYYDFSSMIFALYFLFTPAIFGIKIRDSFIKFLQFKKRLYQTSPEFKTSNVILFTCIAFLCLGLIIGLNRFINDYVLIFWTLFSVSYIYIYVKTLLMVYSINEQKEKQFRIEYSLLLVFPVMVFINGLSPYLGFKTENSFSMFSNLRTEGGISNHYLIPTDLQVFDYQKNLVKITSTSDPVLLEHAQKDQLITFYDLNNRVSISNPKYVNFIYKGESHEYVIGQNDHMGLKKRPSFLSRKILRFRPISNSGINNCIH
ncbi:MAG TPA: hypothetical protein VK921_11080 [Anditalea sp.]|nr:hypothetical protein [Anditalea sp.]